MLRGDGGDSRGGRIQLCAAIAKVHAVSSLTIGYRCFGRAEGLIVQVDLRWVLPSVRVLTFFQRAGAHAGGSGAADCRHQCAHRRLCLR
ncbi:MAG: hypothetical protein R2873_07985 [Caldilineaceae bacterium]